MSHKHKSIIGMVFVSLSWGLSFMLSKHAMNEGFPPMTLALIRYLFASVILTALTLGKEKSLTVQKGDIAPIFVSGLFGITLYYYFEYTGIGITSTVNASIILAAIPVFTLIAETVTMRMRLTVKKAAGTALSLAGVAFIVCFGAQDGTGNMRGDLFILGASLVWVGYLFVSKKLRSRYSSLKMNALQALSALLTLIPPALLERDRWVPVSITAWLSALLLAAVCSALCYWLYGNALSVLTPLSSAIFVNIIPLAAILAGVVFLGETLAIPQVLGGLMVTVSVFVVIGHSEGQL